MSSLDICRLLCPSQAAELCQINLWESCHWGCWTVWLPNLTRIIFFRILVSNASLNCIFLFSMGKKKYAVTFFYIFHVSFSTMPSSLWTDDLPSYFTEKAEAIWYNLHSLPSSPSVIVLRSLKLSLVSSSFLLFPPVSISFPKEILGLLKIITTLYQVLR